MFPVLFASPIFLRPAFSFVEDSWGSKDSLHLGVVLWTADFFVAVHRYHHVHHEVTLLADVLVGSHLSEG